MTVRHVIIGAQHPRGRRDRRLPRSGRCSRRSARRTKSEAREPHAVPSPTRTSRAAGSNACRAGRCSSRRSSRSRCRSTGCTSRRRQTESTHLLRRRTRSSAGEVLFANPTMPDVRSRAVAAVRELPRRRRAGRPGARPRSTARRVTWKAPPLNTVLLRFQEDPELREPAERRSPTHGLQRHRHHHLRPARHADAGVGCRRAAARRTTSRSRTSSRTSASIQLTPGAIKAQQADDTLEAARSTIRRRRARSTCRARASQSRRRAEDARRTDTAALDSRAQGAAEGARTRPTRPTPSSTAACDDDHQAGRATTRRRSTDKQAARVRRVPRRRRHGRRPTRPRSAWTRTGRRAART